MVDPELHNYLSSTLRYQCALIKILCLLTHAWNHKNVKKICAYPCY